MTVAYIDEYGSEHTVSSLTKRLNAIPELYWKHNKNRNRILNLINSNLLQDLGTAAQALEFIEYEIDEDDYWNHF